MPPGVLPVLVELRRWSRLFVLTDDNIERIDAVVSLGPELRRPADVPAAVWVDSRDQLNLVSVRSADAVISSDPEVLQAAGSRGLFPGNGNAASLGTPIGPVVRARLRAARGLPAVAVLEHSPPDWLWEERSAPLEPDLVDTALGCASVVIVTGSPLLRALAWGAPAVTDEATAAEVGAAPQLDVVVAETPEERRQQARLLTENTALAARLSWAGRMLIERRHDTRLVAAGLIRRLGLGAASSLSGHSPLALRLSELGTPAASAVVARANVAIEAVSGMP